MLGGAAITLSLLGIVVSAKVSTDSGTITGGYQCSAYLNVHDDSYSAYAETTADRGLDENSTDYIYVSVSFYEYNSDLNATYSDRNECPNYTTAYISASGYNPDTVIGSHAAQRGQYAWFGSTSVSYTE